MSLAALTTLKRVAQERPHAPALRDTEGRIITYAEFADALRETGALLAQNGIGSEDIVAVLLPASALQVIAVAGILDTCACAALQSKSTTDEVREWLLRIRPAAILLTEESQSAADLALSMGLIVFVAKPGDFPSQWRTLKPPVPSTNRRARSGALLYLVTSGTTGASKIVPLTAQNLDAGIEARRKSLQLSQADRMLLMTSMCHIIGVENVFAQFLAEGEVMATSGFDSTSYLGWLNEYRPTWYDCSPTVHQAALVQLERGPLPKPVSLRFLQSAGAPLPKEVKDRLEEILQVPVFNDYGMTEACPIAIDAFLPDGKVAKSAGRSCGLEISILDDDGKSLPPGVQGEIAVRGAAVISGYLDQPEADAAAFRDGWFLTGDAGYLDAQENLFVTGRFKEMINRGGEKIAPSEVDAVMNSHPAVLEAVAFGVPHRTLGEDVACAVIVRKEQKATITGVELRRFAARHLAPYKVPHRIQFVDSIPRGELGKPQRWVLIESLGGRKGSELSAEEIARLRDERGPVFAQLHELWRHILDRETLGLDEDFFDAGGDSLAAMNMLMEADQLLGSETAAQASSFLEEPTLEHLTNLVELRPTQIVRPASSELKIFPVRSNGGPIRLFCVPADRDEGYYFWRLAKHLEGRISLAIVRPENMLHSKAISTLENTGREMAALLKKAQPQGPYILAGFCYGGIVAVEAARALAAEGLQARLVLFDVPMPNSPRLFADAGVWLKRGQLEWRMLFNGSHPDVARSFSRFAARLAWTSLLPFHQLLIPVQEMPLLRKFLRWAQAAFPLYRSYAVNAPILHFLCTDEPHMIQSFSRFGWRKAATGGIEEKFLQSDHANLFHESNLPAMAQTLEEWLARTEAMGGRG